MTLKRTGQTLEHHSETMRSSLSQEEIDQDGKLCKNLDSRTTNSELWRIVKKINKEQEQCEGSNSIIDTNGRVFPDDKAATNGLAVYYQETSKLVFTSEDKSVMKRARTSSMAVAPLMWVIRAFVRDFSQRTSAQQWPFWI
ncbi:hypothetical protein TNCV_2059341 [Trichonephila clavipes]|nr:hypothetical protein TNCV_2059341 [Trichonephila clavipes]